MLTAKQLDRIVDAVSTDSTAPSVTISVQDFEALCQSVEEGLEAEFENDLLSEKNELLQEELADLTQELEVLTTESSDL